MAWFDWLTGIFTGSETTGAAPPPIEPVEINPATGNPYGTDLHRPHEDHVWSAHDDYAAHSTHDHWNDWSSPAGGQDAWRDW